MEGVHHVGCDAEAEGGGGVVRMKGYREDADPVCIGQRRWCPWAFREAGRVARGKGNGEVRRARRLLVHHLQPAVHAQQRVCIHLHRGPSQGRGCRPAVAPYLATKTLRSASEWIHTTFRGRESDSWRDMERFAATGCCWCTTCNDEHLIQKSE